MVGTSGLMDSSSYMVAVAARFGFFVFSDRNCEAFFAGSALREFSSPPCLFIDFSGLPSACWAVSLVCFFVDDAMFVVSARSSQRDNSNIMSAIDSTYSAPIPSA